MAAVPFSVAFFGTLLLAVALDVSASPLVAVVTLAAGTLLVLSAREVTRPDGRKVAIAAIVSGALAGLALSRAPAAPGDPGDPHAAHFAGPVVGHDGERTIVTSALGRVAIPGLDAAPGTTVAIDAALAAAPRFRTPSPHPAWPRTGAVDLRVTELRRVVVLGSAGWGSRALHAIRGAIRRALTRSLDAETAGVARALVLGDARAVDADVATAVRGAGLAHVLAVSGLHVTLVVGTIYLALRALMLRLGDLARRRDVGRLAAAVSVPFALAYAELCGGAPSAWRAALTGAAALGLRAAGRRPRSLALCAACVVPFAAWDPLAATSPAFVLSVAATAAVLEPSPPGTRAAVALARTSARATVATAPIVVWCFGSAPLVGVLANVIVVPVACGLLLPLALAHAGLATLELPGSGPSALVLEATSRAFVAASDALARAPVGQDLPPLDLAQGVLFTALCAGLLLLHRGRDRAIALAVCVVLGGVAEVSLRDRETPRGELRVTFVDVGQGDAAILDLPDGRLVLVDAGGAPNGGADPGARAIVPLLRARRRARIDLAVITHPHPDHYGGLAAVAERFPIREVWDTGQAHAETAQGVLALMLDGLAARGARVRRPIEVCGHRTLAGVRIEVLWPCPRFDPGWEPNDNSLVLRVRYGERTFVLAGDAEAHTERELAGRVGRVDVLKVGHHGSRTSSSEAWLAELSPWLSVVSAGRLNRFGHPHPEIWERLERASIHAVRTDRDGGVVVRTDGRDLAFETWSGRGGEIVNE